MAAIYSNVKFKNKGVRETGDGESGEGSSNTNDEIIYSEVRIVQSDKTVVVTTPNAADPSHPNRPGSHDPADSSPEAVTPALAKQRLLLCCLCAVLFAAGLIVTVLYVLGKISPEEKFVSEKVKIIEQLQTENTNLNTTLEEKGKIIDQLQTENTNLNTTLKERDDKIKQLEKEKGTCDPKSQNVDEICCAVGWKYFSGKCYFFSGDTKTWIASRDECLAAGGDLVIISSLEELDFLKRSKPGSGREHYWIGLSDAVKEGDWRWLDGTKLNNTPRYWKVPEPDNWKGGNNEYPEGENCSDMEISSSHFSLYDRLCDEQIVNLKRVCEAKVSK
ncbi:asialoglycoprotein receptor 2 isoform X16 [Astyanax mexicanus]|uniref:asialoglycoprotein receptor 2 isoform X15 n=1 Tax=Astyanax mexicanus TaxID=7994 RepID=UPI0020CB5C8C|nr:asialoglycoprotein receptor 2 isoform X15 [Astyanax mexicanus]XP_049338175.1 asialoglycoprotein receptor 2 isoform X16 [Astyanax mexicanus]